MIKKHTKTAFRRRDATGHLDPRYAAELLEQSRENRPSDPPPSEFINDASDDLREQLGEDFVQAATSAEDGDEDAGDELIRDEPMVPDGDDDDLGFEAEELSYPAARSKRAKPEPPVAPRAQRPKAKAGKSTPRKATAKTKAKPAKAKVVRGSSGSQAKAAKGQAVKSKSKPKKSKPVPARKASKRKR